MSLNEKNRDIQIKKDRKDKYLCSEEYQLKRQNYFNPKRKFKKNSKEEEEDED